MNKNLSKSTSLVEKDKMYDIKSAIELAKKVSYEKFDSSVEVSFNLNLDVKQSDQQLRGIVILPHGNGKVAKVLVIGNDEDQKIAKKAKADFVGDLDIMTKIEKENWFDFDFIVTTPEFMPRLARFGKILGPKGLMPNPKLGTVTTNIEKAVNNIKKGQIEYRTNDNGLINISIGKKSFTTDQLIENFDKIYSLIKSRRPATVKGDLVISIFISTTMGPGIKVEK